MLDSRKQINDFLMVVGIVFILIGILNINLSFGSHMNKKQIEKNKQEMIRNMKTELVDYDVYSEIDEYSDYLREESKIDLAMLKINFMFTQIEKKMQRSYTYRNSMVLKVILVAVWVYAGLGCIFLFPFTRYIIFATICVNIKLIFNIARSIFDSSLK